MTGARRPAKVGSVKPGLTALLLALAACHGAHEPDVDEGSFPERYEEARCRWALRCLPSGGDGSCRSLGTPIHFVAADPVTRFVPERAESCLRRFAGGCHDAPTLETCLGAFEGTLPEGAGCSDNYQCAPGLRCDLDDRLSVCSGTCVPAWGEGERCRSNMRGGCAEGLVCHYACREGCLETCERLPVAGESCLGGFRCAPGYFCDPTSAECYPSSEGEGRPCDVGRCPPEFICSDGSCTAWRGPRPGPSDPCSATTECPTDFACSGGVCTPEPILGEACSAELPCLAGECTGGACSPLAPGAFCDHWLDCGDGRCRCTGGICGTPEMEGVCEAPAAPGEACNGACTAGLTCRAGICVDPYASCDP